MTTDSVLPPDMIEVTQFSKANSEVPAKAYIRADTIISIIDLEATDTFPPRTRIDFGRRDEDQGLGGGFLEHVVLVQETAAYVRLARDAAIAKAKVPASCGNS